MNNKGFMMAEVIVVSAIILILLASLFVSYNKIYSQYDTLTDYYDVQTLYRLQYYRNVLIENDKMNYILNEANNSEIVNIYNSAKNNGDILLLPKVEQSTYKADRVFLIKTTGNSVNGDILNNQEDVHETFKDYIQYLINSVEIKSNYVMVMERCSAISSDDNVSVNVDDCKYAYLEVYDGYEK